MKHFSILLFCSLILLSCKPTPKEAMAYSDTISLENNKISEKYTKLVDSYVEYRSEEMDASYADVKKQIEESIEKTKKMKDFHGDSKFKNGAIALFESYLSIINNEHKRIIELLKLPESEYQQEQIDEQKQLIESANNKIDEETNKLHVIQQEFAKPFNIELLQDKGDESK